MSNTTLIGYFEKDNNVIRSPVRGPIEFVDWADVEFWLETGIGQCREDVTFTLIEISEEEAQIFAEETRCRFLKSAYQKGTEKYVSKTHVAVVYVQEDGGVFGPVLYDNLEKAEKMAFASLDCWPEDLITIIETEV